MEQNRTEEPLKSRPTWVVLSDNLEEILAAGLLLIVGCSMGLQIILRTLFSMPLGWPEELAQFLFIWASFFGAIGAIKRMELIRVEYFFARLPGSLQVLVRLLILIAICAFLALLGWKGWQLANRTSFAATALPITWAWAYSAIPAFSAIAALRLLQAGLFGYRFSRIEQHIGRPRAVPPLG
ncbi:TRAP transporter small permease [Telmatospirillum sp. J64-1]|uniref:TRAP transporter small permease n=1 Tax=Telmatospirillum sp. J64-1 TaxID=2502183 RepID=UPI00115D1DEF|nr:TRAP transporter small permease [Telmatospirillum sp. J64-1]